MAEHLGGLKWFEAIWKNGSNLQSSQERCFFWMNRQPVSALQIQLASCVLAKRASSVAPRSQPCDDIGLMNVVATDSMCDALCIISCTIILRFTERIIYMYLYMIFISFCNKLDTHIVLQDPLVGLRWVKWNTMSQVLLTAFHSLTAWFGFLRPVRQRCEVWYSPLWLAGFDWTRVLHDLFNWFILENLALSQEAGVDSEATAVHGEPAASTVAAVSQSPRTPASLLSLLLEAFAAALAREERGRLCHIDRLAIFQERRQTRQAVAVSHQPVCSWGRSVRVAVRLALTCAACPSTISFFSLSVARLNRTKTLHSRRKTQDDETIFLGALFCLVVRLLWLQGRPLEASGLGPTLALVVLAILALWLGPAQDPRWTAAYGRCWQTRPPCCSRRQPPHTVTSNIVAENSFEKQGRMSPAWVSMGCSASLGCFLEHPFATVQLQGRLHSLDNLLQLRPGGQQKAPLHLVGMRMEKRTAALSGWARAPRVLLRVCRL